MVYLLTIVFFFLCYFHKDSMMVSYCNKSNATKYNKSLVIALTTYLSQGTQTSPVVLR